MTQPGAPGDPDAVSVVIPVRDDADYLDRCLRALARQTVPPGEVIVVDNGSTDGTREVAATWHARCVVEPRPGIPAAASAGYDAALCPIIARLDSDSVPPPGWIARVVDAWRREPGLDAVTGPGRFDGVPRGLRPVVTLLYMRSYFALFVVLLGRPPLFGSNFAMRRDVWRASRSRVHRGDAQVHDDIDLSFALPRGSRVRYDAGLELHVSSRPFSGVRSMLRRVWRGVLTVAVNRDALVGSDRRRS